MQAQIPPKLITPFEKNNETSATYQEVIAFYKALAAFSPVVKMIDVSNPKTNDFVPKNKTKEPFLTDIGKPLHLIVLSKDKSIEESRQKGKVIYLINNGIHPGEPEGIDASMMWARKIAMAEKEAKNASILDHITIVIIPVYNIDGCLNRNSYSRANQLGPAQYGFRGNAQNFDLNRDFVKCDSRNALLFNKVMSSIRPHLFVDTHTSNGADYYYTMTLIPAQKDKLSPILGKYLDQNLLPSLYKAMEKQNWEMIPYVNADETPDGGIYGFLDLPRYSTGYAALHNVIGFMPETHMLKPFPDRVKSTYAFIELVAEYMLAHNTELISLKKEVDQATIQQEVFPIQWELDKEKEEKLWFKGYAAKYKPSEVSGLARLYYDKNEPYRKEISFWNTYKTTLSVQKPKFYVIPQAYSKVIERLEINGVKLEKLTKDSVMEVEMYYITAYESLKTPFEGHYLHRQVKVKTAMRKQQFYVGDVIVYTNQPQNRYIIETLEPQAPDSFFAWNFFDAILQQKEHFSAYIFEDTAADWLKTHPELQKELDEKRKTDENFAKDADAQLEWVYQHTPYYEPTHNLYPVARGR